VSRVDPIALFAHFGVDLKAELHGLGQEEAAAKLDELKQRAKKVHKRLALKHHPDVNDGDDTTMKMLNNAMTQIEQLAILTRPKPKPVMRGIFVQFSSGAASTSTTTSTGTWSSVYYTRGFG